MFSKANLISTLVTALWSFFGGYLLWGILGESIMGDHLGTATGVMREEPDYIYLALGCLITAFAFSTIYSKWARGAHSLSHGAEFGLWIGLLSGLGYALISYATSNILEMTGSLADAALSFVYFIVMGILASIVYSKVKSAD